MLYEYNGIVPPRFHRAVNHTMTKVRYWKGSAAAMRLSEHLPASAGREERRDERFSWDVCMDNHPWAGLHTVVDRISKKPLSQFILS
jgi:hypothetical protein